MKYILLALAMALIVAVTSCEHGKVELPVGNTGTDTVDIEEIVDIDTTVKDTTDIEDTTSGDTTAEVTTVTESSGIPETSAEISTSETVTSYDESTYTTTVESEVKVYVNPIPWEPAIELRGAYRESRNITVYYHSGENCVKFELVCNDDKEDTTLKINDNIVDLSETEDIGLEFSYIYIGIPRPPLFLIRNNRCKQCPEGTTCLSGRTLRPHNAENILRIFPRRRIRPAFAVGRLNKNRA